MASCLIWSILTSVQFIVGQDLRLLQSVEFEVTGSSFRAALLLGEETDYRIGRLENPKRYYLDLTNTVLDQDLVNQRIPVQHRVVERIRVGQNKARLARVVFDLKGPYRPEVYYLQDPWRLIVEIRSAEDRVTNPVQELLQPPKPAQKSTASSPKSTEALSQVLAVDTRPGNGYFDVEVRLSRTAPFQSAELSDPLRIYFDLPGTRVGESIDSIIPVGSDLLKQVRVGQNQVDVARVVFDLKQRVEYRAIQLQDPSRLLIRLEGEKEAGLLERTAPEEEDERPVALEADLETLDNEDHWMDRTQEPGWIEASSPTASPRDETTLPSEAADDKPADASGVSILDEIVARVNDDYITLSDLRKEQSLLHIELSEQIQDEDELQKRLAERKKSLLQDLIERKLITLKGEEMGLSSEVEARLREFFAGLYGNSVISGDAHLSEILRQRGVGLNDFRRLVREKIFSDLVLEKALLPRISVMPSEVVAYYEQHIDRYQQPASVELAEIFISASLHGRAVARNLAEEAYCHLLSGKDFSAVASELSESRTASEDGHLGWFRIGSMNSAIEKEVFHLDPGETTGIVELPDGFQIVRVLDKAEGNRIPFNKASMEIRARLEKEKFTEGIERFKRELLADSFIDVAPKFQSEYELHLGRDNLLKR